MGRQGHARDGLLHEVVWVALSVDGANVAISLLLVQGDVLPDEDSDAYPAEVKAIQERVDFWEFFEGEGLLMHAALQLDDCTAASAAPPSPLCQR
jgi:hypothetical protein